MSGLTLPPPRVDGIAIVLALARGLERWATIRDVQGGNGSTLFIRNDLGDLSNKASSALEGDVAPEPGYGDNETIPKAN
jgi:hypothetical protein